MKIQEFLRLLNWHFAICRLLNDEDYAEYGCMGEKVRDALIREAERLNAWIDRIFLNNDVEPISIAIELFEGKSFQKALHSTDKIQDDLKE